MGRSSSPEISLNELSGNSSILNSINSSKLFPGGLPSRTPNTNPYANGYNPSGASNEPEAGGILNQQANQTPNGNLLQSLGQHAASNMPNFNFNLNANPQTNQPGGAQANAAHAERKSAMLNGAGQSILSPTSTASPIDNKLSPTNGLLSSAELSLSSAAAAAAAASCGLTNNQIQNWLNMSAQLGAGSANLSNALNAYASSSPNTPSGGGNLPASGSPPDFPSPSMNQLPSPLANGFPSIPGSIAPPGNLNPSAAALAAMHNPYIYKYIIHPRYLIDFVNIVNKKNES